MSRANPQATIVSEEQLVPRANRLVIKKINQRVASDSDITNTMLRFVVGILRHHKLYKSVSLFATVHVIYLQQFWTTINHNPNTRTFTFQLDTQNFTLNAGLLRTVLSDSDMHSEGQELPLTKLAKTFKGNYIFRMEIPDTMIDDAFKKPARYKYYRSKKAESEKAKANKEPEEKHVSLVKSGRGKGYMRSEPVAVELAKSISIEDQRHQQRKIMTQLTINRQIERDVEDTYPEWGQKCKGHVVKDPDAYILLDLRKGSMASMLESLKQAKQAVAREGSSAAYNKYHEFDNISATNSKATQDSSRSNTDEEKDVETDDFDDSDMDLFKDEPRGDDDVAGFGTLLNDPPANELLDFKSNPVYTNAQTTLAVIYPEVNPELTSYISCASEVPLGTYVDVKSRNIVLQEISLRAKVKKLMQKAKKNIRKINFKRAVTQKFKEYDQKLEALTAINVSKAINKVVHAKVLTKMKKLIPTHVLKVFADYVKPRLNNSVLEAKKLKEIIHKDKLTIADLKGAGLEKLKLHYKNDVELEYHVDQLKSVVLSEA
ncbi:hypothetical protein Tco_0500619 [Tanacetum coccineum]